MKHEEIAEFRESLKRARAAFDKLSKRWDELVEETGEVVADMTKLRRTITALAALCSESPGIDQLGITEACMEVMERERGLVTTNDVLKALDKMGFDLESQKNATASVHSVLSRLSARGKIEKVADEQNRLIKWKGPNYSPFEFEEATGITDEDIPF